MRRLLLRQLVGCALFLAGIAWIPYAWHSRLADRWYGGDAELQSKLANGVEFWMREGLDRDDFATGSKLFDGEWLYGTYVMAAIGFGQLAAQQPENKEHYLALMEEAIDEVLSDRVRQFDIEMWKSDPLETLDTKDGHAAYLGYVNLAMGLHRHLNPDSKFADLNDRISAALRRRIETSPTLLLESYPHETYPVDNCAVIASVVLNGRLNNIGFDDLAGRWAGRCRRKYMEPKSGLLFQAVNGKTGAIYDFPRGSGTTLGLFFLSFMDPHLSEDLYQAVKNELAGNVCGFGLVREYARGVHGQNGDIDSGAVIFGYGLSPTGFALGGARIHGDRDYFKHLYATAHAAGAPLQTRERFNFVTGASLGDAILFAMLTAQPGGFAP
ncbi:hypothetical protein PDESU_05651 [Pontiella desulfatans]|uniref:Linalool dehydratase/isomerase domain-containing protein n=1 Tax=Pontiella desulfatans TaxID=2750659 RepID=A0A6C2UBR1_PONDE|nr:hypothetical protein [Pontiella desulfatans]VGO17057.1 hypothetical protein PDESU_05651 [Pontiella desulfatans]